MGNKGMTLPPFMEVGHRANIGHYTFTSEEIVAFARKPRS